MQRELEICIQKAKELASREPKVVEPLDPDVQAKLDLRKLKQAARSKSIIYTLGLQVKEVQEHLEKGHDQKIKSASLQRLAAAHRGALRVLYVFIQQLSDTTCYTDPPNFEDLAKFIRQMCLCTTKVELNKGSAVPHSALNILQKLEILNSDLNNQYKLRKKKACPPLRKSHHNTSFTASRGAFVHQNQPVKAAKNVKAKEKAQRKPKAVSHVPTHRRQHVLQACVKRLAEQWEHDNKADGCFKKTPQKKHNQANQTDFLQPTVSAQLRENHLPQKEPSVPANVTSPVKAEPALNLEKKQQAQEEEMRYKAQNLI
ncbi:protein moonraker-like [Eucyclogobius newberryi]|uniref:protein moonraker-like n=1 Tax=Eucyclogobius newberryi TaxID=166745 RepID=UPI003B5B7BE8